MECAYLPDVVAWHQTNLHHQGLPGGSLPGGSLPGGSLPGGSLCFYPALINSSATAADTDSLFKSCMGSEDGDVTAQGTKLELLRKYCVLVR